MTRAAIYTRVSSEEQVWEKKPKNGEAEKKASLKDQEERCRAYAKAQAWEVAEVYEDAGVSGAKADRPALNRLLVRLE